MPSSALRGLAASVLLLGAPGALGALAAEGTNSTVITSQKLSFNYRSRFAVFEGNVFVSDPQVQIWADRMTVIFEKDNSMKMVTAAGNVRIQESDRNATCEKAVYDVRSGKFILSGSPVVRRGQEFLKGKVLVFWRNEETMEGEEVELKIIPSKGQGVQELLKE